MQRTQFTFYESFFKAISRIKKKADRADAYDIICSYALYQIEPNLDSVSDAVAIAFELLRPVLDKAKERAESGKKGGSKDENSESKTEAKRKQSESKTEANAKQGETVSKKEIEKEKEKEKEIEIEKDIEDVCAELPSSSTPPAITLPLADGSEFPILYALVVDLSGLYPAVDVMQQLRNMRGWLLSNPKNRKTKSGIMRFVNSWLAREQNSARPVGGASGGKPTKAQELDAFYGMAAKWANEEGTA